MEELGRSLAAGTEVKQRVFAMPLLFYCGRGESSIIGLNKDVKDNNGKLVTGKNKDIEFEKKLYAAREKVDGDEGRNVERVNTRPSSFAAPR